MGGIQDDRVQEIRQAFAKAEDSGDAQVLDDVAPSEVRELLEELERRRNLTITVPPGVYRLSDPVVFAVMGAGIEILGGDVIDDRAPSGR